MTVSEAMKEFLLDRRIRGLSEKSIQDYREFISPFADYVGGNTEVTDITQLQIREYLAELYSRKLSKATIGTYTRHIKVFLSWIAEEEAVSYNTGKIPVPKYGKKQVHIYSGEEIRMIFECVSTESEWLTLRNKACIALMLDSGLRQGEVCRIRKTDYNKTDKVLIVYGKGDKYRTVPVGKLSEQLIEDYTAACPFKDSEYLFVERRGRPMTCNALKLLIQKLSDKLPFEFSCHKLRHNFATNYCIDMYYQKGQMDPYSLQILLGHSEMKVTMQYIHHAMGIVASKANISHLDMIYKA